MMQHRPFSSFIDNCRVIFRCFPVCLLLFCHFDADAIHDYTFRSYSPEGGFFGDGILSIQQDKDGFIWVISSNALLKLDGYSYKNYYAHFRDLDPTRHWVLNYVAMSAEGELLIATSYGLYKYHKLSDSFEKMADGYFAYIKCDDKGMIWVREGNKIALFDPEEKTLIYPLYDNRPLLSIRSIHSDENGLLLSSFSNRIFYLDYDTMQFEDFYSFPRDYSIVDIKRAGQTLWVLVDYRGLYKIDTQTREIEEFYDLYALHKKEKTPLNTLLIDKEGFIWAGSQGGLYIVDPYTKTSRLFMRSSEDRFTLPNNSVWILKEDAQRNIWLGTYSGGLSYVNLEEKNPFKSFTDRAGQLSHRVVSSFAENDQYLWIGTEGGGINRMDKTTKSFSYYKNDLTGKTLSYDHIKSLALDSHDRLWIAMFRGGLNCLDTRTNQFTHFKQIPNDPNSLYSNNLRKVVLDSDGAGLWIAYQLERIIVSYYSFQTQKFEHYEFKEENAPLSNFIFDICLDNNRQLWMATHKKVYVLDIEEGIIDPIDMNESFYLNAQTLTSDGDNNLWIGTLGNGLIKYNTQTRRTEVYRDILKYDVSEIYSILVDEEKYLWLGTNNGLFRYDSQTDELLRFNERDGIQGRVFYVLSCLKDRTGELYFGGTNGFTIVNPVHVAPAGYQPKPFLTELLVDNVPVRLSDNVLDTDKEDDYKIVFDHNKVNFGFRFSSDNYQMRSKNWFRYRLKGYDDRWIEIGGDERSAYFTKVPPGNYTFEVMTGAKKEMWSEHVLRIPVRRLPAPWFSWWAYVFYFLIVAGIVGFIIYNYYRQKKLKIQLHIDKLDKIQKEQIHQAQLQFFTNISHDFRTPLSLIMAALDSLRQEGMREYYYKILYGNARRLMSMINELMDFRTLENGKMKLQVEPLQINSFLREITSDFYGYSVQKSLRFAVIEDPGFYYPVYGDKNVLEKILLNLLNNAFRYTKKGGSIVLETYESVKEFKPIYKDHYTVSDGPALAEYFCVVIRDTGIGISKEDMERVFDRYYTINNQHSATSFSSGVGLSVVKNLVLLHRGYITLFSEKEKGTDILIAFSKLPSAYMEGDFRQNESTAGSQAIPVPVSAEKENEEKMPKWDKGTMKHKKKILLVEDHDDLRTLIADYLSDHFQVVSFSNGMEVTKYLDNQDADLIISDIMMPVKDGVTLCRETKNDLNTSHIPFILLTAKNSLESKMEGADSGADLYIEKPIDLDLLILMINNIFTQQQKLKEYYAKYSFVENVEVATNEQDSRFFKQLIEILDKNLHQSELDVNSIAAQLFMSRSKLYSKIRALTGKSIIEFINTYKVQKAARLILEQTFSMREIMDQLGIESQSYFSRIFKKEYGCTPSQFLTNQKKNS